MHKRVVSEEIEIFNTSKLIEIRRFQLEQLQQSRISGSRICEYLETQQDLQDLIATLNEAIQKVQSAKEKEDEELHKNIREHFQQVQAMQQVLSTAEFGNMSSRSHCSAVTHSHFDRYEMP